MKPYYNDGQCVIYHGDCREIAALLVADSVVADPPYNVGFSYASHNDSMPEEEYLAWLLECFSSFCDVPQIAFFWPPSRVARGQVPMVTPDHMGLHHVCGWHKQEYAGDKFGKGHPSYSWEAIPWIAVPGMAKYCGPVGGAAARDFIVANHFRHDPLNGGHPCPKPIKVMRAAVQWITPEGGTVVDPFMGSGTTLRAAKDLGRRAIGIEIEERYCEIAAKRLAQGVLFRTHREAR